MTKVILDLANEINKSLEIREKVEHTIEEMKDLVESENFSQMLVYVIDKTKANNFDDNMSTSIRLDADEVERALEVIQLIKKFNDEDFEKLKWQFAEL